MAPPDLDGYEAGRRAFLALVASLPPLAPADPFGRALAARPRDVRDALARTVPRVAFVLSARERGLLRGEPAALLARHFEPSAEAALLGQAPALAVLGAVLGELASSPGATAFEPEALGGAQGAARARARPARLRSSPRRWAGSTKARSAWASRSR